MQSDVKWNESNDTFVNFAQDWYSQNQNPSKIYRSIWFLLAKDLLSREGAIESQFLRKMKNIDHFEDKRNRNSKIVYLS